MNIRCAFCQTPYTLSRVTMLDALQEMEAGNLTHFDAHCPRCRRATQIPRQRMEMFMPNWREELKAFEAEMKEHPQQEAPLPTHEPVAVAPTEPSPAAVEEKPAPKAAKETKPAAKTSSPKGKAPAAKSSAKAKTSSAKAKPATTASKGKKTTKKSK